MATSGYLLATSGYLDLATCGYFFMATDRRPRLPVETICPGNGHDETARSSRGLLGCGLKHLADEDRPDRILAAAEGVLGCGLNHTQSLTAPIATDDGW
jgi:hypothetical protein